ncbi:MAG: hypothetical protein SPG64_01005 [Candidatus Enteromonas sp.]|nr:hypothetical protein [Candidatus Enteromonas sp.]
MKKIKISEILGLVAMALALVAILSPFAMAYTLNYSETIAGITVSTTIEVGSAFGLLFGGTTGRTLVGHGTEYIKGVRAAVVPLIGWIAIVLGLLAVGAAAFLAYKKIKCSGYVMVGAAVLLIAGGILFFAARNSLVYAATDESVTMDDVKSMLETCKYAPMYGVAGPAVFGLLSGISAGGSAVLAYNKK